jgi:hypothetical protein
MLKINNPTIINKNDAINHLNTQCKPVIFWDTCALLDIIRQPLSDRKGSADILAKVIQIKNKILSGDIISLSSELCIKEFNDHVGNCIESLKKESKNISVQHNHFVSFTNTLGISHVSSIDLSTYKLEEDLHRNIIFYTRR